MTANNDSRRFRGRYRIPSARLKGWDYGSNAACFVTLCVRHRACAFGEIREEALIHTHLGLAANDCWLAIPKHFEFVKLDVFVVMPNHVHGIIVIDKPVGDGEAEAYSPIQRHQP